MAETEAILLARFTGRGDAQAFAEIVRRHAGLVYGAALRILADVDRAADVAQETFLQLTKDAGSVTGSLPGWLHRVATHKAIDQMRRDASRKHREREYAARQPEGAGQWKKISPYVDVALRELEPELRDTLILHFLEGRTTREIAALQGASQATISRRIGAGVEQLRARLHRRGVIVAVGALSALLGDNAVQAAPLTVLTELGKMAMVGGVAAGTAGAGAGSGLHVIVTGILTVFQTKAVAVAAVAVIGAGSVVTYHELTRPAVPEPVAVASGQAVAASPVPGLTDALTEARRQRDLPGVMPEAEMQWGLPVTPGQGPMSMHSAAWIPGEPTATSPSHAGGVPPAAAKYGGMMGALMMDGSSPPLPDLQDRSPGRMDSVQDQRPGGPGASRDPNVRDPNDPGRQRE
ncbi:MAG: sigma-70 family RNA polymerase sigma factor [Planctomycetes bacterium]|nr:sigma-70 family RNA polymerase sigma factor [Planctomycetota bacterium]